MRGVFTGTITAAFILEVGGVEIPRTGLTVALLVAMSVAACAPARQASRSSLPTANSSSLSLEDEGSAYMCPMHPEYTADKAGACPRCGMKLVVGTPFDMRNYRLEFQTVPAIVRAGEKITLQLNVFHPGTGDPIKNFERVHERPYHLFVISQDMEYFQHIHPEQNAEGVWSIDVTLPKAGYYKVLSDFVPTRGSAQLIARPLVTAGYDGDLVADSARLVPDTTATKTVDNLTATATYEPARFVAGLYGHVTFRLTNAATREPVMDLQTYLGAFGHMLIMSEDLVEYVHSHPMERLPADADLEQLRGGPDVIFEGLMPKPGRYRAWAQFRYRDMLHTFPFTFEVVDIGQTSQ
jgi:heavy metal-binding protein